MRRSGTDHQVWTANAGNDELTITDDQVVNAYERITGYDPSVPRTDQGAVEIEADLKAIVG